MASFKQFTNTMLCFCSVFAALHIIHGFENIALNKPTYQSNEFEYHGAPAGTFDSSNAVDGLKGDLSAFGGQCVISKNGFNDSTWWVNLKSIYSIHEIRIYYRTDNAPWGPTNGYTARFLGFYVYVSNTTKILDGHLCFHDTIYNNATIPAIANITCSVYGQYVIYYNHRPQPSSYSDQYSPFAHNELCEVEVYGCRKTEYYGLNCSIPCPKNCQNISCNTITGNCWGCKPGYQGNQCTKPCSPSFYGESCSLKCGNCSDGVTCHHVNGSCANGCDVGVYGDRCEMECDGSSYGQDCRQTCGECLDYKPCHYINGSCLEGCVAGYEGELCKTGCSSGKFGINCKQNCNKNCGVPYQCNRITGECKGGCQPGWKGPRCEEVCKDNKYGENCFHNCGFCRDSNCHHVNGSCPGNCLNGYQGTLCNEKCKTGFYGENCKKACSIFCKSSRDCNHVTGHCDEGCIGGWQGALCLQVADKTDDNDCLSRFYGVLAALCVCLIIIAILMSYICIYRWKMREKLRKLKYKEDKDIKVASFNMDITTNEKDEVEKNEYQELGELALPSHYDRL